MNVTANNYQKESNNIIFTRKGRKVERAFFISLKNSFLSSLLTLLVHEKKKKVPFQDVRERL